MEPEEPVGFIHQVLGIVFAVACMTASLFMYSRFGVIGIIVLMVAMIAIPVAWVLIWRAASGGPED